MDRSLKHKRVLVIKRTRIAALLTLFLLVESPLVVVSDTAKSAGPQAGIFVAHDSSGVVDVFTPSGVVTASVSTGYEDGDALAVGDLNADGRDDVAIARNFNGRVVMYDLAPQPIGSLLGSFDAGYEQGDELDIGDVDGDGFGEVLLGRKAPAFPASDDEVAVFTSGGAPVTAIGTGSSEPGDFDDGLAVADANGDGADDVLVADEEIDLVDSGVVAFNVAGGKVASFFANFAEGDGFAAGDLDADGDPDAVIADAADAEVEIRSLVGAKLGGFDIGVSLPWIRDSIDAGNVTGTSVDSIVIGRPDVGGVVNVLDAAGNAVSTFAAGFQSVDALAVGTPTHRSEACAGDGGEPRDIDGDGLPDTWEQNGINVNRDRVVDLDLKALGAQVGRRDIFIELDYMALHKPLPGAIDDVTAAFAGAPVCNPDGTVGITLHTQIDDELPHQDNITTWTDFDAIKLQNFGTAAERNSPNAVNILAAKKMVFHYNLWAHARDDGSSSGRSEVGGNDFIVSLGADGWGLDDLGVHTIGTRGQQAGTFMHELGHNLGLGHGGGDDSNCKPNYLSVMSYTFQTLPGIPLGQSVHLDYSRTLLPLLNEAGLLEKAGIDDGFYTTFWSPDGGMTVKAGPGKGPLDWNGTSGIEQASASVDVNNFAIEGCGRDAGSPAPSPGEALFGHDDWSNVDYAFQDDADAADGAHSDAPEEIDSETYNALRTELEAALGSAPPDDTDTRITSGPKPKTRDRTPTFSFTSDDPSATFECSIDGADLVPCSSPFTSSRLKRGEHTFMVRAVHSTGTPDPTPARVDFDVVRKKRHRR